ncbi:hypothetical protein AYI69_g2051, partial [Smittium culicis]
MNTSHKKNTIYTNSEKNSEKNGEIYRKDNKFIIPVFNNFDFLSKAEGSKIDIISHTIAENEIKSKSDNKNISSNTIERDLDIVREPVNFADRSNLKISNLRKTLTRKNNLEEKLKKMEKIKERAKIREREISDQYFNKKNN